MTETAPRPTAYLSPEFAARVPTLSLRARLVVEGFVSGLHRSPYHGFNVEFAEHREYSPGDDLRYLDWQSYARTEKYHIKLFEEETNLRVYLVLDTSASMGFRGEGLVDKLEYGKCCAASIAYLALKQKDSAGLSLCAEGLVRHFPPSSRMSAFHHLCRELEAVRADSRTDLAGSISAVADRMRRRGLVVLISDLWDDPQALRTGVSHLRHMKYEVMVLHVLDPVERHLSLPGERLLVDMETGERLPLAASEYREEYRVAIERLLTSYRREFADQGVDYTVLDTSQPYAEPLAAFLRKRARVG